MTTARFWDPTGARHGGMPTYPYRLAPDGLMTRRQLRAHGLRPGGQPVVAQILWRRGAQVAFLYRADLALPVREMTEARAASLERAMRARRTCPACGIDAGYCIPTSRGLCGPCHEKTESAA